MSNEVSPSPAPTQPAVGVHPHFEFDLPPFPSTASNLIAELNSTEADIPTVVQLIECEPKIASRVIQLANSPVYGASRPITTIGHGIVLLGFKSVAQLALTMVAGDLFNNPDEDCRDGLREIYGRSLAVAITARSLAKEKGLCSPDEAFLGGVMHDIGKVVFFNSAGSEYAKQHAVLGDAALLEFERDRFGRTHAEVGEICGRKWGLPVAITNAIRDHHASFQEIEDGLTQSVISGEYFAQHWGLGFKEEQHLASVDEIDTEFESITHEAFQLQCHEQFECISEICFD
jgi:putative nucleotidyltransferase with HDIG domain